MLAFLTDAHISPDVAAQVGAKRPEIVIHCLRDWRGGALLEADDDDILAAATEEELTLVTYDQRTIAPMLAQWGIAGREHAGVIFIDDKSIAQADMGGKVLALINLWDTANTFDWMNAVAYLKPAP